MTGTISHRWNQLDRGKAAFLSFVSSWDEARLRCRPDPASWSALEVLDHVIKVESAFFSEMRKNAGLGDRPGFADRIRGHVVITVMNLPVRVRVPAQAAMVHPNQLCELGELLVEWDTLRAELRAWTEQQTLSHPERGIVRHPVSGWLTLSQSLAFLAAHLRHHRYQLQRIKRSTPQHRTNRVPS